MTSAKGDRKFAAKLCESRNQFGLSDQRFTLAYCFLAIWTVQLGGTVVSNDRSNSFHEFFRTSILDAMAEGVHLALEEGKVEAADSLRAIYEYCILDTNAAKTDAPASFVAGFYGGDGTMAGSSQHLGFI